jgi:spermidine synthase
MKDVKGDIVYGGNVYDGRATADVRVNSNRLDRVYLSLLLHQQPEKVLIVGLSTGAWARSIQAFPTIRHIDIIEINPGYVELIRKYEELAPILSDDRVRLSIDDGRRWLKRHPHEKYDLIIQNTTFHWRAYTTNLLSREYFSELQKHMNQGAVLSINTTGSLDVYRTAAAVYPHAYRYTNFVYASDHPLSVLPTAHERLREIRLPGGSRLTDQDFAAGGFGDLLLSALLEPLSVTLKGDNEQAKVITDLNMLTEYRTGRRFGPSILSRLLLPAP